MKRLFGLSIFQTAIIWFYISLSKVSAGQPPILNEFVKASYANPLPHVLMLTAIVVGLTTIAFGFSLIIQIHRD